MSNQKYVGVWPVMLTPFDERKEIDWASLEKLVEWYLAAGVHGLFADCQSSEMFFLSDDEARKLVRFIVEKVDGRVPVVASGHTATAFDHQREQVAGMAETGVDGVIFISNRLAQAGESDEAALEALKQLTVAVPERVDLGIYECPYPYKRLLSDDTVAGARRAGATRLSRIPAAISISSSVGWRCAKAVGCTWRTPTARRCWRRFRPAVMRLAA